MATTPQSSNDGPAIGVAGPAAAADAAAATMIEVDSAPTSEEEDFEASSSDERASTQSLTGSVFRLHNENGRTYHGYRAGMYPFPNDASEQERLDFQYCAIAVAMQDQLHFAPLHNPRHILDIGTGTGLWAIEMGDKYEDAQIEATDLSAIQPSAVPSNVQFIIDDAEQDDWGIQPDRYDFVHTRILLGCFKDFRSIIAQGLHHLRPGGWMESQEIFNKPYCDDGSMPSDWHIINWARDLDEAAENAGRPLRIANKLKRWYEEAGFVDVQERVFKLPINSWPKDPHLKNLGIWWGENLLIGAQAFSLAYLSRMLGWSRNEIEVYLVDIRNALMEKPPRVHAYHKLYVVWGRKPYPGEVVQKRCEKSPTASIPVETPPTPPAQTPTQTADGSTAVPSPAHAVASPREERSFEVRVQN